MPATGAQRSEAGDRADGRAEHSDAEIIASSVERAGAFGDIFDRHATVLYRHVVRRLGPHDAAEIVGEVFRIAFERRAAYDASRPSARPWLYGIATNLVAKHHRREVRRLDAVACLAGRGSPDDDFPGLLADRLDAVSEWQAVIEAVNGLPDPERHVLLLHVWEGLAYDEVAVALDIPVGTVRSRLNRARRRLRTGREPRPASGELPHGTTPRPPGNAGSRQR